MIRRPTPCRPTPSRPTPLRTVGRPAAAAAELAVLLPFLIFLAVIGADWARLLYYTIALEGVARNGALYASDPITAGQSPYADITSAALSEAPEIANSVTVTPASSSDQSGAPTVRVTASMPFTTITNFPGVPSSQTISRDVEMRVAPVVVN